AIAAIRQATFLSRGIARAQGTIQVGCVRHCYWPEGLEDNSNGAEPAARGPVGVAAQQPALVAGAEQALIAELGAISGIIGRRRFEAGAPHLQVEIGSLEAPFVSVQVTMQEGRAPADRRQARGNKVRIGALVAGPCGGSERNQQGKGKEEEFTHYALPASSDDEGADTDVSAMRVVVANRRPIRRVGSPRHGRCGK